MNNITLQRRQIIIIILIVIAISILIVCISNNFFLDPDTRTNEQLKDLRIFDDVDFENIDERTYHIIFDENNVRSVKEKDSFEYILKTIKAKYSISLIENIEEINDRDYVILLSRDWQKNKTGIDKIFDEVSSGASLLIVGISNSDQVFKSMVSKFGIYEIGSFHESKVLKIKDDLILGLKKGDVFETEAIEDYIFDIHTNNKTKVYLTNENDISIYHTYDYGEGRIGVYNGENTSERHYSGINIGMLGTLAEDFVYPVMNATVMFIDDWPGPFKGDNEITEKQYGMDMNGFLKYIWWPDMSSLTAKYGVKFTGQYVLTYNDIQKPPYSDSGEVFDVSMYSFGQQIINNGGELGLHGYNHQPLWFSEYITDEYEGYYFPWESPDDAVQSLDYAVEEFEKTFPQYKMNCYVAPSNVIDETGVEVVKQCLGTPVIISGLYIGYQESPNHNFEYKDDVIYFPRLTSGSFLDDDAKLNFSLGMGLYGIVSHFIHPDDAINDERSRGLQWEQMRLEFVKMMQYLQERYPYLEYKTVTQASNELIDWYELDYSVEYASDNIKITTKNMQDKFNMIVRTTKEIEKGQGYTFEKVGEMTYFVEIFEPQVFINLGNEG